jgi:pentatricopeptide repeat protein
LVADTYSSIAQAYFNWGYIRKAIEFYQKDLAINIEVNGEKHPKVAQTLNNLGVAYRQNKEYDKAIECYNSSLEIKNI